MTFERFYLKGDNERPRGDGRKWYWGVIEAVIWAPRMAGRVVDLESIKTV